MTRLASELNERLVESTAQRKIPAISVSDAWYGFDPIHLKRLVMKTAWPEILSTWRSDDASLVAPRASLRRWAYLHRLAPRERTIFGRERHCEQPSGMLKDGTTISLY
jgi:hypothetical protein